MVIFEASEIETLIDQKKTEIRANLPCKPAHVFTGTQGANCIPTPTSQVTGLWISVFEFSSKNKKCFMFQVSFEGYRTSGSTELEGIGSQLLIAVFDIDYSAKTTTAFINALFSDLNLDLNQTLDTQAIADSLTGVVTKKGCRITKNGIAYFGKDYLNAVQDHRKAVREREEKEAITFSPLVSQYMVDHLKHTWSKISDSPEQIKAIDPALVRLLGLMNACPGIATRWSCSGHPEKRVRNSGYVLLVCSDQSALIELINKISLAHQYLIEVLNQSIESIYQLTLTQVPKRGLNFDSEGNRLRVVPSTNWSIKWSAETTEERDSYIQALEHAFGTEASSPDEKPDWTVEAPELPIVHENWIPPEHGFWAGVVRAIKDFLRNKQ